MTRADVRGNIGGNVRGKMSGAEMSEAEMSGAEMSGGRCLRGDVLLPLLAVYIVLCHEYSMIQH